jgi:hypothetical protein
MDKLEECWEEVRAKAQRPYLPVPKWDSSAETAQIDLRTMDIKVSPAYIAEIVSKGVDEETAIKGRLEHELEHFRTHPYDLASLIYYHDKLRFYGSDAELIENLFSDIKINISAVANGRGSNIFQACRALKTDDVRQTILAFEEKTLETGFHVQPKYPELEDKLGAVDFYATTLRENGLALLVFAQIIKPYLDKIQRTQPEYSIAGFSPSDIKKAIKHLQQSGAISPADADRIYARYGIENSLRERYITEAAKYPVHVEPAPLINPAGSYPATHTEWSIDRSTSRIDPFVSFGLLVPGITKEWQDEEYISHGTAPDIPECLICLDTSGSMVRHSSNSPALIAALAVVNKYLTHDRRVAAVNFSDKSLYVAATKNLYELADLLCTDQAGGTTLDLDAVKKAYESLSAPDVHIITDTDISNIGEVLGYLASVSRPNLWVIGRKVEFPGIACHHVENADDIPKAVVGGKK